MDKDKKAKPSESKKETAKPAKKEAATKKAASSTKAAKASAPSDKPAKPTVKQPVVKQATLVKGTLFAKMGEYPEKWKLIDASGQTLGRLSSHVAQVLMGKLNPYYTRSSDTGDHVVVINAQKIVLTGNKWNDKMYHHHTGYPGGIKSVNAKDLHTANPDRLIKLAVYRMLPKGKGHRVRQWFKRLKVYAGSEHPHIAQQPETIKMPYGRTL